MSSIYKVVASGNCIGCGACAFAYPDRATMQLNDKGHWQAVLKSDGTPAAVDNAGETICPMSGETPDETEIAAWLYPETSHDNQIGRYIRNVVGHVEVGKYRSMGGSGGLVTWLLTTLLETGKVDAVIHVHSTEGNSGDLLFEYGISNSVEDIFKGAKSRYYPVQMADVLTLLSKDSRRFAVVGLPCFLKAVRLLERSGQIPSGRVQYTIGLVCGHLKSRYFGEYLAWQKDIMPEQLVNIDFRRKLPDRSASNYGFAVQRQGAEASEVYPMKSVKGRDWGEGLFKNPACEFCDDVLAECADIAVGDAWLPKYVEDWRGTNVAVIRSNALHEIIAHAERDGLLDLEDASVSQIIESQAAGLRHRRRGLMHRLARRKRAGKWAPRKRVAPMLERSPSRRKVYDLRLRIAEESSKMFAEARAAHNLELFEQQIAPLLQQYQNALRGSIIRRIAKSMRSRINGVFKST